MSLKTSRNPQALSSFRILGLNAAQGRLQEEIWAQLQPKLWMHTGSFHEGRSECLMAVASDLCVIQMRSALGLPSGMVLVDRQEAFDSQWRPSMLLPPAKLVPPALWCVMDELHKEYIDEYSERLQSVLVVHHKSWCCSGTQTQPPGFLHWAICPRVCRK